jgi:1-acyl-sn-glycerol-3-phosphate acyltransferase
MPELKPQVYKDPRPAEFFTPFHERARARRPDLVYDLVRLILTPLSLGFYRARAIGTQNVPEVGPMILAPNHFSQMDHFFAAVYLRRHVRFMAKSQLFSNPAVKFIFAHGGVFPVRRGHADEEAFVTARTILGHGGCVLMYAEGGRSRSKRLGQPRPGVGRLALETGVPVVPVAIHGSQDVRGWKRLRFPKVTVQYGDQMRFEAVPNPTRDQSQAVADEVFGEVRRMFEALDEKGRRGVIRSLREAAKSAGVAPPPASSQRSS